jgi:hypothetical protein
MPLPNVLLPVRTKLELNSVLALNANAFASVGTNVFVLELKYAVLALIVTVPVPSAVLLPTLMLAL